MNKFRFSQYLSEKSAEERIAALTKRIAKEATLDQKGKAQWHETSDFWRVPALIQQKIKQQAFLSKQSEIRI
jgi:hypothetical protein